MELVQNTRVVFNEMLHSYLLDDEYPLIGVTSLMRKHSLSADYSDIDEGTLRHAAEIGTLAHKTLEAYDNGEAIVEGSLIKSYRKLGLNVICSEYLISDNKMVASSIDKVLATDEPGTVDLADVKRTSTLHKTALSWQLGIYKYLFEKQNPGIKVRNCYCIHIRKGNKDDIDKDTIRGLIPIQPVSAIEVELLFGAEALGLIYSTNEKFETEMTPEVAEESEVAVYIDSITQVKALKEQLKTLESGIKEFEDNLYNHMLENGIDSIKVDGGTINLKRPYEKRSVDSKKLQTQYPEVYESCLSTSLVKGGISYKPNNN